MNSSINFFNDPLDISEISESYGIDRETIERWEYAMHTLYPAKDLRNRDFLLHAKTLGWKALQDVDLIDYTTLAIEYRDRLLDAVREEEPDFGLLYKATEREMRRYDLHRWNLLNRIDASFLKSIRETPVGRHGLTRGAFLWLESQRLITIEALTEQEYSATLTEKGKWALFVYTFYHEDAL